MASTFHLSVLTPEKSVLEQDVAYIQAPGIAGYLGVLAHHAPLIAALAPGKLTVREPSGSEMTYALSGGFLEVSDNKAVILADSLEPSLEIDVARARESEKRARERMAKAALDDQVDVARAEASLHRAINRIRLSS